MVLLHRLKQWVCILCSPSKKYALGIILTFGFIAGIIFWGGFHTVVEATNTESFCISCHEMRQFVYKEYQESIHYANRTGVRAVCADCHVPKSWGYKMLRKVKATGELYHKLMGTISTAEKFEVRRLYLAQKVWDTMKATDSRECRNCHAFNYMKLEEQDKTAQKKHARSFEQGKTCIDCHKGIAHQLPSNMPVDSGATGQ